MQTDFQNNYSNIHDIKLENTNISIESNGLNSYIDQKVNNNFVCEEYLKLYKNLALSNPKTIYDLMPNEYKNIRFGSLEEFEEYIEASCFH